MNPATIQCMLEETPCFPSLSQNLTEIFVVSPKFHFEKSYSPRTLDKNCAAEFLACGAIFAIN